MNLQKEIEQRRVAVQEAEQALEIALNRPKYAPTRETFSPLAVVEDLLAGATNEADRQARIEMLQQSIAKKKQELAETEARYEDRKKAIEPSVVELRQKAEALRLAQIEVLNLAVQIYQLGGSVNREFELLNGEKPYQERIAMNPEVLWVDLSEAKVFLRYANLTELRELTVEARGMITRS